MEYSLHLYDTRKHDRIIGDQPICECCKRFLNCTNSGNDNVVVSSLELWAPVLQPLACDCVGKYACKVLLILSYHSDKVREWAYNVNLRTFHPVMSRRRLLILFRVLELIALKLRRNASDIYDHIRCIRHICVTISEPFITIGEMKVFLCSVMNCDESDRMVQEICWEYEREFPTQQPKTLTQLSRNVVHHCLRVAGALHHGVHELGIPNSMEEFILNG